jgi:hypothetical protein
MADPLAAAPTAFPALRELSFDFFAAAGAMPWLFDRFERCKRLFQNRACFSVPMVVYNPELRPAFDGRQLARRAGEIKILDNALDAKRRQDILEMTHHQRIFGRVNSPH